MFAAIPFVVIYFGLVLMGWGAVLTYCGINMDVREQEWKPTVVVAKLTPRERRRLRRQRTSTGRKRRWKKGMRA